VTDQPTTAELAEAVDDLTNPILIREPIYHRTTQRNRKLTRLWTATVPSLLTQLHGAMIPGVAYVEDDGSQAHTSAFASAPPARLEAINALLRIEAAAAVWCNRADVQWRKDLSGTLRALVGVPWHSDDRGKLLKDLHQWHSWAATLSGWQNPPWRPHAACPACDAKHSLRVRTEKSTAACVECGAWWDDTTIGILADHITRAATRTTVDTAALRTLAVLQRRAEDAARIRLAGPTRPDLPYVAS